MTTKDLKYYLEHADEMPTDIKEIERLTNEQLQKSMEIGQEELTVDRFSPEDKTGKDEIKGAPSSTEEKTKEEPKEQPVEAKVEEAKPEGILAKDGKNIIPFAVLSSARERAEAAERLVAQQQEELERLKAGAGVTTAQQDTQLLTPEELDALSEDSPTLAKVLRAQQETIQQLTGTVQSLASRTQMQDAAAEAETKSEVQEAIDSNPTLSAWQVAEDQTLWNEAAKLDKVLRESPGYKGVPFAERFAKVVKMTQIAQGLEEETGQEREAPAKSTADIKAAAQAKLTAKAAKAMPVSLSQIPGGAEPAADERSRIEQMSTVELGNKLLKMSPEEQATWLASL